MKTSANGRKFIEQFEGLILQAYDDANDHIVPVGGTSQGVITIGYGHTSAAGAPKVFPGQVITRQQADDILASDLSKVEVNINKLVKVSLNQNQFDALVSFDFNTGALGRSSILTALNKGNYEDAANRILLYNKAGGKVLKGLVRRREGEKAMFLKKDTPVTAPVIPTGSSTTASVAVGGGLVYTYWHAFLNHWMLYTLGLVAVAVIGDILIHKYKNRKTTDVKLV